MQESIEATAATIAATNLPASQKLQAKADARNALESYRASSFDRSTMANDFDKMARWAREHSVPMQRVILGEFGAMNNEQRGLPARQDERLRWIADVRAEAEVHGFPWAVWVHSGSIGFSLVKRAGSQEIDPAVLGALGLE